MAFKVQESKLPNTFVPTWQLARDLGGEALVELVIEETHTCYLGQLGVRAAPAKVRGMAPRT